MGQGRFEEGILKTVKGLHDRIMTLMGPVCAPSKRVFAHKLIYGKKQTRELSGTILK